ncbi:MAG: DinB family protein [Candidatus Methylomirabilales bacterium]
MLSHSASVGLETQLEALPLLMGKASPDAITRRLASGKWSAHENLAHLARHHEVFIERIQRILTEDRPRLARYRAEEDPQWPKWAALPTDEVLRRLQALRGDLVELVKYLSPEQFNRIGVHPAFGEMTIPEWIEFFLLHEAHHLYIVMTRIRGASVGDSRA